MGTWWSCVHRPAAKPTLHQFGHKQVISRRNNMRVSERLLPANGHRDTEDAERAAGRHLFSARFSRTLVVASAGKLNMSGWQRIGVVISVLWLIGLPTFLFIDTNIRQTKRGAVCVRGFIELSGKLAREGKQAESDEANRESYRCWEHQGHVTPMQAFQPFVSGTFETLIVWAPVVILWILKGALHSRRSAGLGEGS